MADKSTTLKERFGQFPNESGLIKKMRAHQGWWRTNVLNEEAGPCPKRPNQKICNTISNGELNGKNFLTPNAINAVKDTLANRSAESSGLIDSDRLFNNLLSSQPLCFNFFGELYADLDFGLTVLKSFYNDLTKLISVNFEFAPIENYTKDNSAFDVAFVVEAGDRRGLIGFESKYTESFSATYYGDKGNKNHDTYLSIYNNSKANFASPYFDFVKSKSFNQLFRNQLIAESLLQNKQYDFIRTGLFCHQEDESATKIARDFKTMLTDPDYFQLITYSDYISKVQQLDLTWEQREWTMLLWARYCGTILSDQIVSKVK